MSMEMQTPNVQTAKTNTYDAIVIGSGITGGWAAKELTEKGLQTLCSRPARPWFRRRTTSSTFPSGT